MGLALRWALRLAAGADPAPALAELREAALDLPFARVTALSRGPGEIVAGDGTAPDWLHPRSPTRRLKWADPDDGRIRSSSVDGSEPIGFVAWPGDGCEEVHLTLARFPERYVSGADSIQTGWDPTVWYGEGFTKTQYASTVSAEHFLRCHTSVVALLDSARELGILGSASDDGNYLESRDVRGLLDSVGRHNAIAAGLTGALMDQGWDGIAPIGSHPEFEHLEMEPVGRAVRRKVLARGE